jgi:hypothetical protein
MAKERRQASVEADETMTGASSHLAFQVIGFRISLPHSKVVVVSNGRDLTAFKLSALLPRCPTSPMQDVPRLRFQNVMQRGCGVQ